MSETRLNIRISPDKKELLQNKVDEEGKTITDVLMDLIDQYLGLKNDPGEILQLKQRVEKLEVLVIKDNQRLVGETSA